MKILYVLGDAEYLNTDQKGWRLAARLKQQLKCEMLCLTNEEWAATEARALGLECQVMPFHSQSVLIEQRIDALDKMIAATQGVTMPGGDLPLWKLLAFDDFAGSLLLHGSQPAAFPECDLVVLPMITVDSNTKGACGLVTWAAGEALARNIPRIMLETGPIGNKQVMGLFPATCYAVKDVFSRQRLMQLGIPSGQIVLLHHAEGYLLSSDRSDYVEAYLAQEQQIFNILQVDRKRFVVVIPHHVGFLWEVKQLLRGIHKAFGTQQPYTVAIRADPNLTRRQYNEVEMVTRVYEEEIRQLPHCIIETGIGHALLFQAAQLICSPLAYARFDQVMRAGTPLLIHQAAGIQGWENLTTRWEPDATKIAEAIQEFGVAQLFRTQLANVVEEVQADRA